MKNPTHQPSLSPFTDNWATTDLQPKLNWEVE